MKSFELVVLVHNFSLVVFTQYYKTRRKINSPILIFVNFILRPSEWKQKAKKCLKEIQNYWDRIQMILYKKIVKYHIMKYKLLQEKCYFIFR